MIKAVNISKKFGNIEVFQHVNVDVPKGKIISLLGASGEGKSTLLQILGLLDKPSSGEIYYNNERVDHMNAATINKIRNQKIGFIFQFHHLFPEFSALENVCIPAWAYPHNKKLVEEKAIFLLQKMGLSERLQHKPKELSGGEQQRVAVARSLINNPELILADEPTGNLDAKNAHQLYDIFAKLNQEFQQSFLIVTHNEELASRSHLIWKMKSGVLHYQ